jgi:hypothetical protein
MAYDPRILDTTDDADTYGRLRPEANSSAIPSMQDNPNGLHQRYRVTKLNGEPTDPMATYFVLRLDHFGRDGQHIAACREAARTYCDYIDDLGDDANPILQSVAKQLRTVVENLEAAG